MQYPPDQPPHPFYPQQPPQGSYPSPTNWQQPPQSTGPYTPSAPGPGAWQQTPPPMPPAGSYAGPPSWQQQAPPPYPPTPGQQIPNWQSGQPPQQPHKKSRKGLWITLAIVVLILIVIGVVTAANPGASNGAQSTGNSATSAPTQASQATPTVAGPTTYKVGETATLDNWSGVVHSAKISPGGEFDTPQHAGDVFLEISVTVTNNTGSVQTFSSLLSFALIDSSGQKYDETVVTDAPGTPDGNIANGGKLKGTVSYEVPTSMKSFEFDFAPDSLSSTDVAVWTLTV